MIFLLLFTNNKESYKQNNILKNLLVYLVFTIFLNLLLINNIKLAIKK